MGKSLTGMRSEHWHAQQRRPEEQPRGPAGAQLEELERGTGTGGPLGRQQVTQGQLVAGSKELASGV